MTIMNENGDSGEEKERWGEEEEGLRPGAQSSKVSQSQL
jgi:hypothetical protein